MGQCTKSKDSSPGNRTETKREESFRTLSTDVTIHKFLLYYFNKSIRTGRLEQKFDSKVSLYRV